MKRPHVSSSAVAALFVTLAALGDAGVARAAEPIGPPLPRGVHRTAHGRYVRDRCDRSKSRFFCLSTVLLPEAWTPDMPIPIAGPPGSSNATGMAPADILTAYAIPPSTAAHGKIVAVLDSPDSSAFDDMTAYRAAYSLPVLPKCNGAPDGKTPCFAQVAEDGSPSTGGDSGSDGDGETGLDIDMISAACPDCSILLVELGDDFSFNTGVATAATMGAVATSISFGGTESTDPTCSGQACGSADPTGFTTPGHLVLVASGDFAYDDINMPGASPSWPSSAPDVIAVGGTDLFANGSSYDEGVWNDGSFDTSNGQDVTTSGCSTEYAMPLWQATALKGSSCTKRATADFSSAATFTSGGQEIAIAAYSSQSWSQVEGTSASSPMMAGILTRLGLAETISKDLSWPYAHAAAFNDLGSPGYPVDTQGSPTDSNTTTCGVLCTAGPGWDGPSGLGTPNGVKLVAAAGGSSGGDAGASGSGSGGDGGASGSSSGSSGSSGSSSGSSSASGSSSGGATDAGSQPPVQSNETTPLQVPSAGCGCTTTRSSSGAPGLALVVGLVLAGVRRRVRRRRAV